MVVIEEIGLSGFQTRVLGRMAHALVPPQCLYFALVELGVLE